MKITKLTSQAKSNNTQPEFTDYSENENIAFQNKNKFPRASHDSGRENESDILEKESNDCSQLKQSKKNYIHQNNKIKNSSGMASNIQMDQEQPQTSSKNVQKSNKKRQFREDSDNGNDRPVRKTSGVNYKLSRQYNKKNSEKCSGSRKVQNGKNGMIPDEEEYQSGNSSVNSDDLEVDDVKDTRKI
jgi:hypothetical protein